MNSYIIKGTVITPFKKLIDRALCIKNGKIEKIIKIHDYDKYFKSEFKNYIAIEAGNNFIGPGFIDIHTHGSGGADSVRDPIETIAEFKVKNGTTAFFPTLMTSKFEHMLRACERISNFIKIQKKGSRVMGINSEGPYLNPKFGAQKKEYVLHPNPDDFQKVLRCSHGNLKIMTIAPELTGASNLIKYLVEKNVIVSLGHTGMSVSDIYSAINLGAKLVTHIFNAMGVPVKHERGVKQAGIQEELLITDDLMCEVISDKDGIHVKPTLLKILIRCKSVNNIILITDSMSITGSPPGKYCLHDGRRVLLKKGGDVLRLENNDLIGSTLTMNGVVRNIIHHTGCTIEQAIQMASFNPARITGLSHKKGKIEQGMDADIIIFDRELKIKMTMVEGIIEYNDLF